MSTQAQVTAAVANFTLANANTFRTTQDPAARDAYIAQLLTAQSISPIDDYAVNAGRQRLIDLRPIA